MATNSPTLDEIISTIRGATKRLTIAKRLVGEILVTAPGHLTAEEIIHAIQERRHDISPSTVYRILDEFEDLQIVVHSHLGQQAAVYHLTGSVHGHLTCQVCATTIEIPGAHFDALSKELQRTYNFLLDRHHVALAGTCAECQTHHREQASIRPV